MFHMRGEDSMNGFEELSDDDLFVLARRANQEVFARARRVIDPIARRYCRAYTWIDPEDLSQQMLAEVPRVAFNYREDSDTGVVWTKYLYHRMYFVAKDCLRKQDPLGISYPQKKHYPQWHRLGDECLDGFDVPARHPGDENDTAEDEFQADVEQLRNYFAGLPKPAPLPFTNWDRKRNRQKFRVLKEVKFATFVHEYFARKGKPVQMTFQLG